MIFFNEPLITILRYAILYMIEFLKYNNFFRFFHTSSSPLQLLVKQTQNHSFFPLVRKGEFCLGVSLWEGGVSLKICSEVFVSSEEFTFLKVTGDDVCHVIVFACYAYGCEL